MQYIDNGIQSFKPFISAMTWHSACGYFFVQQNGPLRGFFLEDGMDNQDGYVEGIIFTHDGRKTNTYSWSHEDYNSKFAITQYMGKKKYKNMLKTLKPVLDYAEVKADGWPGP